MSNTYGFDFLRTEHLEESNARSQPPPPTPQPQYTTYSSVNKPDLEKQADILAFLKAHRGSGCLAPSVIYQKTGIDLEKDVRVAESLQKNPKVKVELVPDPENPALMVATYAYQAKFSNVRDKTSLLAQINRMVSGIPMRDLQDSYAKVEEDLGALITAGDVIAVANNEDKDKILFPRGEAFLVELDGIVSVPAQPPPPPQIANGYGGMYPPPRQPDCISVETDVDPRKQIRRGEAVQVGGEWFRLSSCVKEGVPLSDQPARAQAPLSVVSMTELSSKNELDGYTRPFTEKKIPLDAPLSQAGQRNIYEAKAARERLLKMAHGRSGGVMGQLLGSNAHHSNPKSLASSFAGNAVSSQRKRPTAKVATNAQKSATIPKEELEKAAANPSMALFSHAKRHGCTLDVREMYLATRKLVPEEDVELKKLLVKHKLLEPNEELRPKRLTIDSNLDKDGKPKKRRYYERKNQRMTNIHLDGTEIGAALVRAIDKKKEGKSAGDGGM